VYALRGVWMHLPTQITSIQVADQELLGGPSCCAGLRFAVHYKHENKGAQNITYCTQIYTLVHVLTRTQTRLILACTHMCARSLSLTHTDMCAHMQRIGMSTFLALCKGKLGKSNLIPSLLSFQLGCSLNVEDVGSQSIYLALQDALRVLRTHP